MYPKITIDLEWRTEGEYSLPMCPADIHVMSIKPWGAAPFSLVHPTQAEVTEVLANAEIVIGHNLLGADFPALLQAYGIRFTVLPDSINGKGMGFMDTLVLSRAANPDRQLPVGYRGRGGPHSLEAWGYRVGRWKPEVADWQDLPIEAYVHRCEEDCEITELAYKAIMQELRNG